jgi:hypothetical protein
MSEKLTQAQWVSIADAIRKINSVIEKACEYEERHGNLSKELSEQREALLSDAEELYDIIIQQYDEEKEIIPDINPPHLRNLIEQFIEDMEDIF